MFRVFFSSSSALLLASQRYKLSVYRRYNDFDVFHEVLLQRFAYRMVPAMPPKRMLKGGESVRGTSRLSPLCALHIGRLSFLKPMSGVFLALLVTAAELLGTNHVSLDKS